MATEFTQRLLLVVKAAARTLGNEVAQVADPTSTGDTFTVPLRLAGDATNTPVAYWTGWTMTPEQRQRLADEFGRRAGSFTVYLKGQQVPTNANYWAFLDAQQDPATGWTPAEVLAALGYDRLAPTDPTTGG